MSILDRITQKIIHPSASRPDDIRGAKAGRESPSKSTEFEKLLDQHRSELEQARERRDAAATEDARAHHRPVKAHREDEQPSAEAAESGAGEKADEAHDADEGHETRHSKERDEDHESQGDEGRLGQQPSDNEFHPIGVAEEHTLLMALVDPNAVVGTEGEQAEEAPTDDLVFGGLRNRAAALTGAGAENAEEPRDIIRVLGELGLKIDGIERKADPTEASAGNGVELPAGMQETPPGDRLDPALAKLLQPRAESNAPASQPQDTSRQPSLSSAPTGTQTARPELGAGKAVASAEGNVAGAVQAADTAPPGSEMRPDVARTAKGSDTPEPGRSLASASIRRTSRGDATKPSEGAAAGATADKEAPEAKAKASEGPSESGDADKATAGDSPSASSAPMHRAAGIAESGPTHQRAGTEPIRVGASAEGIQFAQELDEADPAMRRQNAAVSAVNQMTLRRAASAEVDLPDLGRIRVDARNAAGEVDVRIEAQKDTTNAILSSSSGNLENSLRNAHVPLRDLWIGAEQKGSGGAQQQGNDPKSNPREDREIHPEVRANETVPSGKSRRVRIVL